MRTTLAVLFALTFTSTLPLAAQSVTTAYTGEPSKHGNMFDVVAWKQLTVDSFDVHFADLGNPAPCAATCSVNEVEVYYSWGGHGGKEVQPSAWVLRGSVQHTITTGPGEAQPLALPVDIDMPVQAEIGFYVTSTGNTNSVTGLPNERMRDTNAYISSTNTAMSVQTGTACNYPFQSPTMFRAWNGTVHYSLCGSGLVETYCTAGTSSNGCQAKLSTSGVASATAASAFVVTAPNVEGQKTGLFYFGTSGRIAQPWGSTSSFKCVGFPTRRGALLNSGGTAGACDGTFSYDLNTHWSQNPLHNPGPGVPVQLQLWYRDPAGPSPNTAFSDALEFALCP